jgi:hypothetical protein
VVNTYIFLCDPDSEYYPDAGGVIDNRRLPEIIKFRISQGEDFVTSWRCANTKSIQVGDKAYLVKTVEDPKGFIASGKVVAAAEEIQLRRTSNNFADLSPAYTDTDGQNYWVCLALDTVVDFDYPLEQRILKSQSVFKGVNFYFAGGGKRFAPDNPAAVDALASAWESHCLVLQNQGRGRRLVDVFLEKGDQARTEKDYVTALENYYEALEIDPNYGKLLNKIKICKSLLQKTTSPPPEPPPDSLPAKLKVIRDDLDKPGSSSESVSSDAKERVLVEIARRQGQSKFRQTLLDAYDNKCAVIGFDAGEALEAAHIIPYVETEDNDPTNGLLLRADIHTLFDLNLLAIHPDTLEIFLHPDLKATEYRDLHGQQIHVPYVAGLQPNPNYLKKRLELCTWLNSS